MGGRDDRERKLVVAIPRSGQREPEPWELAKEPALIRGLFQRLIREGRPVAACYEGGVSGYDL